MRRAPIVINGKFLSARPTGVHRVAAELIQHMDRALCGDRRGETHRWSLMCPRDATGPLELAAIQRRRRGLTTWQAWEQLELPSIARGAVLVNLCNLAPLTHARSITLIHDAQVFLSPQSYSAPFRAWYRFALPRIGAAAARIVTVSEFSRDQLVEFGVAPRERISVIHNGVDHFDAVRADSGALARLGLRPGGYVIAVAGAQKHKNLGVLFEAFRAPGLDDLTLVVAGPDGAPAFIAAGAPPPDRVVFAGRVTDAALRALYENAVCLAFPSTTEGFGLPPLEAMSVGCPTIVAPCGALPEVCGEAALFAPPHDPPAWSRAIRELADDPRSRARLTEAGVVQAAQFRWRDSASQLISLIDGVAQAHG
jgi:glycosyltransferase involved in cell wall biosynthesis